MKQIQINSTQINPIEINLGFSYMLMAWLEKIMEKLLKDVIVQFNTAMNERDKADNCMQS